MSNVSADPKGGTGIWSELLNKVSSGLPADSPGNTSTPDDSQIEESLTNGEVESQSADGSASGTKFRSKHILIIGDADCGKSTLLSVLKGASAAEKPTNTKGGSKLVKSGYALDYYYLDIESEELDVTDDEIKKCSVWVLRGASGVHSLLQSQAYSPQMVPYTLFTLVLDFSEPWNLKQSLENGIQHIQSIISKLEVSPDVLSGTRQKLERRFQLFCENEADAKQKANTSSDDLLPLSDGVLTLNLGVPIMVICTKLDALAELEKSYKFNDEHFDYIQQFLRLECLKYGASLAYTSSKDPRYVSGLYKLILNSLYEVLPKSGSLASVVEKDSIFVPIGWDSLLKIKAVQENLIGEIKVDDLFEDVCKQPSNYVNKKNPNQEANRTPFLADEEQIFLNRSQSALQKPVAASTSVLASPGRPSMPAGASRTPLASGSNASEQSLQTFFNSLLSSNRTRGSTSGSTASGMSSPARNSALATPDQRRMTAPPNSVLQQPGVAAAPPAAAATPVPATSGSTEA